MEFQETHKNCEWIITSCWELKNSTTKHIQTHNPGINFLSKRNMVKRPKSRHTILVVKGISEPNFYLIIILIRKNINKKCWPKICYSFIIQEIGRMPRLHAWFHRKIEKGWMRDTQTKSYVLALNHESNCWPDLPVFPLALDLNSKSVFTC